MVPAMRSSGWNTLLHLISLSRTPLLLSIHGCADSAAMNRKSALWRVGGLLGVHDFFAFAHCSPAHSGAAERAMRSPQVEVATGQLRLKKPRVKDRLLRNL